MTTQTMVTMTADETEVIAILSDKGKPRLEHWQEADKSVLARLARSGHGMTVYEREWLWELAIHHLPTGGRLTPAYARRHLAELKQLEAWNNERN